MLNKLAVNQYVKMVKPNDTKNDKRMEVEYGVVLNEHDNKYDVMSVGFENKNGVFLEYSTNVENLVQTYTTQETAFDEVKENEVRRKMDRWLERNYK
ncbi:hypothetical protein CHL78_011545 [Romboutsia weinsteinii]|uniref:Uncharacterized protein n=1 Tax=Romboutsia weinsteinii TaxID=2020949 RepID=A0A371J2D0_9FIRM|nr:hypothetical protein [Romboutsia weinsteinii]RDY26828.1 hypothetical protein CHL78_011545 [Romboutsia weinsteinii]